MTSEERPALTAAVQAFFLANTLLDPMRLQLWDRENMTVTQLRLLFHLIEQEGVSNAELAERLYVTRPSVSALLERLERNGCIRREVSPLDRRGIRIFLEPKGREVAASGREEIREYIRGLMEELDDAELEQLAQHLQVLVAAGRRGLAKAAADPGPAPDS